MQFAIAGSYVRRSRRISLRIVVPGSQRIGGASVIFLRQKRAGIDKGPVRRLAKTGRTGHLSTNAKSIVPIFIIQSDSIISGDLDELRQPIVLKRGAAGRWRLSARRPDPQASSRGIGQGIAAPRETIYNANVQ